MAKHRPNEIRRALLTEIFWKPESPVAAVASGFGVTRQAVQRHLRALIEENLVTATGRAPHQKYELRELDQRCRQYELAAGVEEDRVWQDLGAPILEPFPSAERDICSYGLTEMVNNVIDHSEGKILSVVVARTAISVDMMVLDDGIGIFQKIATALKLADPRQSILELSKGKFTTDPRRHTGKGVFFTSRVFDRFSIRSQSLYFLRTRGGEDWLVGDDREQQHGTCVLMDLFVPTSHLLEQVFSEFSSGPDDYRFAKTHVPLKLAQYGDDHLVSRSQAKRVLARVERFEKVLLDFEGVRSIGQAFADEAFRVFAREHPGTHLVVVKANKQVLGMIARAQAQN